MATFKSTVSARNATENIFEVTYFSKKLFVFKFKLCLIFVQKNRKNQTFERGNVLVKKKDI